MYFPNKQRGSYFLLPVHYFVNNAGVDFSFNILGNLNANVPQYSQNSNLSVNKNTLIVSQSLL